MRIMGVDYGDVRIGLAVSDEMNILVGDAWTLTERNADLAAEKIADEVQKRSVQRIVLGLPKNMDGSEGSRAEKCRLFAQKPHPRRLPPQLVKSVKAYSKANIPLCKGKACRRA